MKISYQLYVYYAYYKHNEDEDLFLNNYLSITNSICTLDEIYNYYKKYGLYFDKLDDETNVIDTRVNVYYTYSEFIDNKELKCSGHHWKDYKTPYTSIDLKSKIFNEHHNNIYDINKIVDEIYSNKHKVNLEDIDIYFYFRMRRNKFLELKSKEEENYPKQQYTIQ